MGGKSQLAKLLGKEKFAEIEGVFRKHFQLGLETTNIKGKEIKSLSSSDCHPEFCGADAASIQGHK